jgi:hypothetical protein
MNCTSIIEKENVSERVRELCKMLEEGGIRYSDELIGFSKPVGRHK